MSSYSRTLLVAFGMALVLLAVSSLVSALRLSQDVAAARQQAQVWKTYALAVHSQGLLAAQGGAADCSNASCCVAASETRIERPQVATEQAVEWLSEREQLLSAEPLQALVPSRERQPVRGFSF